MQIDSVVPVSATLFLGFSLLFGLAIFPGAFGVLLILTGRDQIDASTYDRPGGADHGPRCPNRETTAQKA
ncbi:MAG: hypothetical protein SGJ21_10385 [Alphaproteobacteria bacterium]|nr:hypothetical protein [Alphaproteobacteria bacterium]